MHLKEVLLAMAVFSIPTTFAKAKPAIEYSSGKILQGSTCWEVLYVEGCCVPLEDADRHAGKGIA